jgi:hypothetical protein
MKDKTGGDVVMKKRLEDGADAGPLSLVRELSPKGPSAGSGD